ncbi:MAG: hypothetical protein WC505_01180 [Patescibacteria group bacterium]
MSDKLYKMYGKDNPDGIRISEPLEKSGLHPIQWLMIVIIACLAVAIIFGAVDSVRAIPLP